MNKKIIFVLVGLVALAALVYFFSPSFLKSQLQKEQSRVTTDYPWVSDLKSQISRELNLKDGYPDVNIEKDAETGNPLISLYFPSTHLFGSHTGDENEKTLFSQEVAKAAKIACQNAPKAQQYIVEVKTIQHLTEAQKKVVNNRALQNTNKFVCTDF